MKIFTDIPACDLSRDVPLMFCVKKDTEGYLIKPDLYQPVDFSTEKNYNRESDRLV